MNPHVHRFYRKFADEQAPIRLYHEVIGLHEAPHFSWEALCFFALWSPSHQAGNVYCSPMESRISDAKERSNWQENLAFPTYLDWLVFYLESIGK